MRLTLIHNPSAGSGRHSADELRASLRAAGYDVAYQTTDDDLARALDRRADLVLVAGGDGAVAKVAKRLVGREVPLAILPLGTANNIARSLRVHAPAREVIAGLRPDDLAALPRRRLDLGTARAPWGAARFVESAGVGLLTSLLRDAAAAQRGSSPDDTASGTDAVAAGRRRMRRVLDRARRRYCHVEADGEDLSGEYLWAEAVNTRYVGPRVALAPAERASAGDGYLQLALLGEADRAALDAYLARDAEHAEDDGTPVPTRRVRRVRLGWHPTLGHLDDEPWPEDGADAAEEGAPTRVELAIVDSPIEVVVPAGI